VTKPGNMPEGQTEHVPAEQIGGARYLTREEQLRELLEDQRRRNRRAAEALVRVFNEAPAWVLPSIGVVLDFVWREGNREEQSEEVEP